MRIVLGKLIAIFGIKGELKVKSATDFASLRFQKGKEVYLLNPLTNEEYKFTIKSHKKSAGIDILGFENINDNDIAKKHIGFEIITDERLESNDNMYQYIDLFDCKCFYDGKLIGTVADILNNGTHSVLRIKNEGKKDILYPFIAQFITSINVEDKEIILNPIKGMLEG